MNQCNGCTRGWCRIACEWAARNWYSYTSYGAGCWVVRLIVTETLFGEMVARSPLEERGADVCKLVRLLEEKARAL